ncbi:uncharacterized protein BX664DRAFT_344048 [Halteromyces radiatus]|uniref:uncharacterized protein n=1 Tax=Halteromyces radiatus TaxID=101107 RepID=UPI0022205C9F|nr:uncharacterized protein BX664DRAFT_344048 [Halteromyces radiatus]KAI8076825.1 hypothetical protein BX664DRAFT_344048 [Halteromyces radiatus]
MAFAIPVIVGAPIGYFTWSLVCQHVDYQVAKLCYSNMPTQKDADMTISQQLEHYPTRSLTASMAGSVISFGVLGKTMFPERTRHRLFFAKAPPQANLRIETLKLGIELLARCGVVFYGTAVVGAITGRLAVANSSPKSGQ